MNNMTLNEALNTLYSASRLAPLTADQHQLIKQCGEQIAEALKPKDEPKKD